MIDVASDIPFLVVAADASLPPTLVAISSCSLLHGNSTAVFWIVFRAHVLVGDFQKSPSMRTPTFQTSCETLMRDSAHARKTQKRLAVYLVQQQLCSDHHTSWAASTASYPSAAPLQPKLGTAGSSCSVEKHSKTKIGGAGKTPLHRAK